MDRPEYTPDQIAEIKTKKMTLMLDLNETQQTKIMALELEAAKARELKFSEKKSDEKPSDEERFKMQSERLDRQIAHKKSMKSILTKTQFEKWEKSMPAKGKRRNQKGRKGMKGEKRQ
jgi:phosphatidate phosphatase PAH1